MADQWLPRNIHFQRMKSSDKMFLYIIFCLRLRQQQQQQQPQLR